MKHKMLFILYIITAECENGWTRFRHKCIKFYDLKAHYSKAEETFKSNGSEIITIDSAEENEFVYRLEK